MEKLLILDSNSLLNRAFYALPTLTTSSGIHTNAIYGFTQMLLKLKEDLNPDYIIATFDMKSPTIRYEEYKDYKASKKNMPPELSQQIPIIKDLLKLLSIKVYERPGFESVDIIGSLSKYTENNNLQIYIVTADNNALQLASDNVNIIITKKGISETVLYNKEIFIKEYGVRPSQFIDVKGLTGDKSRNIPGVPGIGEKTACKLIQTYGSIEDVFLNIDSLNGKKFTENLKLYKEQVILSKKLATIITEIPFDFTLQEIRRKSNYDKENLKKLLLKLQIKSILSKLQINSSDLDDGVVHYKLISDFSSFENILKNISGEAFITYEMSNSNKYSEISLVNLIINDNITTYLIDFKKIIMENFEGALQMLKHYMADTEKIKIIHDAKSLITYLNTTKSQLNGFIFDTSIAAYLIDSSKGNYTLPNLIKDYLGDDIQGDNLNILVRSTQKLKDVYIVLRKIITENNMTELYFKVEHPLINILSSMESEGFNIDTIKLNELAENFKKEIIKTENEIFELSEEKFNINSPKQLGKILFEKLDLPVIKKTKTGYSTNADVLEKLSDKHIIIPKISYYRQITKLNSTYVEGLKNLIDTDGKIHSNFNQTVTTTGRLSSTEPNLQNIPIKYEMGREIRKIFIPNESTDVLISCDYSQIELRVLAHMSQDDNMISAFNHHSDIHAKTASEVFNVSIGDVTPIMRSRAKAVNFGIVYGISDFSLAQDLKITKREAAEYMSIYFERYPKIKSYLEGLTKEAIENGYVLTVLNRRRFIPEIKSSNKIIKASGERLAMNAPIQGSAADIIKLAMVNVYNKLKENSLESKIILQVHDELILNVKENEINIVKSIVKNEMQRVLELSVALEVDLNTGLTWYEAK